MPPFHEDELKDMLSSNLPDEYLESFTATPASQYPANAYNNSAPHAQDYRSSAQSFPAFNSGLYSSHPQPYTYGNAFANQPGYNSFQQSYSHQPVYETQTHSYAHNVVDPSTASRPSYEGTSYTLFDDNYGTTQHQAGTISPGALSMDQFAQSYSQGMQANSGDVQQSPYGNQSWSYRTTPSDDFASVKKDVSTAPYTELSNKSLPKTERQDSSHPPNLPYVNPIVNPATVSRIIAQQGSRAAPRTVEEHLVNIQQPLVNHSPFLTYDSVLNRDPPSGKSDIPTWTLRRNSRKTPLVPGVDLKAHAQAAKIKVPRSSKKIANPPKSAKLTSQQRVIAQEVGSKSIASPLTTSTPSSSSESSSSDDDSESEYEDEMAKEKIDDIRAQARPQDVADAAAWDVTGILWRNRKQEAYKSDVVEAVPKFQEYIITLRDDVKKMTAELQMADLAKKAASEQKKMREAQATKRRVLASALESAVKTGHPMIVRELGSSAKLVMVLSGILSDSYKLKDYTGALPKAVLSLMAQLSGLTDALLQRVKFEEIAKRFIKQGDAEIKENVNKILASTPEGRIKAEEAAKEALRQEKIKNGLAIQERARARDEAARNSTTSSKRPNDGDLMSMKPAKKPANESASISGNSKPATARAVASVRPGGLFSTARPVKPIKPLPGSSAATAIKKPDPPKPTPASAPKSSLLGDILASIANPLPAKKTVAPERPYETPEQKVKRERKESRRHLRVQWKEGSALEEVRLFKHEQAEDEGRQDDMLRDAHDDRSEGMRLKEARVTDAEIDEEDEVSIGENDLKIKYYQPDTIDFGNMSEPARNSNYTTRGGKMSFRTPQQNVQEKREMSELMVVYTDAQDIPPTPKEPTTQSMESTPRERYFGQPKEQWVQQRFHNIMNSGPGHVMPLNGHENPVRTSSMYPELRPDVGYGIGVTKEEYEANHEAYKREHGKTPAEALPDVLSILKGLQEGILQVKERPVERSTLVPAVKSMDPAKLANLESVCAYFKGKPFPATGPPEWMNEAQKKDWMEGFNRDQAVKIAADQKAAADLAAEQQAQMIATMQYPPPALLHAGAGYQPYVFPPPIHNVNIPYPQGAQTQLQPQSMASYPPPIYNQYPIPPPDITNPFPPSIPGIALPLQPNMLSQSGQDYGLSAQDNGRDFAKVNNRDQTEPFYGKDKYGQGYNHSARDNSRDVAKVNKDKAKPFYGNDKSGQVYDHRGGKNRRVRAKVRHDPDQQNGSGEIQAGTSQEEKDPYSDYFWVPKEEREDKGEKEDKEDDESDAEPEAQPEAEPIAQNTYVEAYTHHPYPANQNNRGGRGGYKNNKRRRHVDLDDMGPSSSSIDQYGRSLPGTMPPSANELHYKGKKKPCRFWLEGKCAKGDACGFLHNPALFGSQA